MDKPTHKLGELLMQAGLIDEIQLRSALGHQKRWGGKLGKALVDQGFIDEEVMLKFLAERFKMKAVNLIRSRIAPQTFEMVPQNVAKKYEVVPVVVTGSGNKKTIVLAMSDPSDLRAIDEVQFLTAAKVEPVLATDSAIAKVLQHYGDFTPEMAREFQYEKTAKPMDLKQAQGPRPAGRPPARPPASGQAPARAQAFGQTPARAPAPAAPPRDEGIDLQNVDDVEVVKGEVTMIKAMKAQAPARPAAPGADEDSVFLIRPERGAETPRPDAGKAPPAPAGPPAAKPPAAVPDIDSETHGLEEASLIAPPLIEEQKPPAFFVAPSTGEGGISDSTAAPPAVPDLEPDEAPASSAAEEPDEIEPIDLPEEEPGEIVLADAHEFIQPQSYGAAPADDGEKLELAEAHEFISPPAHDEPAAPPWEREEPPEGPPAINDLEPPSLSDEFLSPAAPAEEAPEPAAVKEPPHEDIAAPSPVADQKLADLPPLISDGPEAAAHDEVEFWGSAAPEPEPGPKIKIEPAADHADDGWGADFAAPPLPSPSPAPSPAPPAAPADDVWGAAAELPSDDIWAAPALPGPAAAEPPIPDLPPLPDLEPAREEAGPPDLAPAPAEKPEPPHEAERPEDDFFEAAAPESDQELEYGIDRSDHAPPPPEPAPTPAKASPQDAAVSLPFEGPPPDPEEPLPAVAPRAGKSAGPKAAPPPPPPPAPEGFGDEDSDDLMKIFQPGAMSEPEAQAPTPSAPEMEISILENLDSPSIPELGSLPELDLQPLNLEAAPPAPAPAAPQSAPPPKVGKKPAAAPSKPKVKPPEATPPPEAPGAGEDLPLVMGEMKQVRVSPDESPETRDMEEEIKRLMDLGDEFLDTREVKKRLAQLVSLESEVKHREYQFDELLNLMMRKELGEITQELFMKELQVLKKKADAAKKGPGKK